MTDPTTDVDVTTALARAAQATAAALDSAQSANTGSDLVLARGTDAAAAVKAQLAAAHAQVATARKQALAAHAAAKEVIEAKRRELDAQMSALAADLAPLQETIARLQEGIATLNLYTGRDEEIVTLATGAPAPADTPIHVRQQVLAMDEESALAAESGGIDVRDIDTFDQWITADPAHLDQVLPETRGVVAIMPRRESRDYGDPWATAQLNAANKQTWWLIRNGENVYRMLTDFTVGKRLVPARNEFTSFFVDRYTRAPLQPGTRAWLDAEKAAGARERHFMKIALILQGLVDRTAVFAPLPVAGLSLLSPEHYDAGHVILIADDEHTLTTGRVPFYTWLAERNRQLTPGMRVIVNVAHQGWRDAAGDTRRYGHRRVHPNGAESPSAKEVYTIRRRGAGGALVITYPRTHEEWLRDSFGRTELRVPATPASCTLRPEDKFVLPVDLVSVQEMRTYLSARTERHAYAAMFPTLKAAIAFKEAEAAAEAPFRDLLTAQIAQADATTLTEAAPVADELVTWWKLANRWNRALVGDPAQEARAAKAILTEHAARRRAQDTSDASARILDTLKAAHRDALFIARKKAGTWVVATPTPRRWALPTTKEANHWGDQVAPLDVFVDLTEYTASGRAKGTRTWQVLEPSVIGRWTMLHTSPAWQAWNRRARRADHLTDDEIDTLVDALLAHAQATQPGVSLLAAAYWESERQGTSGWPRPLRLWTTSGTSLSAPARPLTGKWPRPTERAWSADWERRGGQVQLVPHGSHEDPWATRGFGSTTLEGGWERDRWSAHVVRLDAAAVEALRAAGTALVVQEQSFAPQREAVDTLLDSVAHAWRNRAVAAAKVRFLEDYADESLWADHVKTLKVTYPYQYGSVAAKQLRYVVTRLVEDGAAPWGQTVGEAFTQLADTDVADGCRAWHEPKVLAAPPADLTDLRFCAEPTGTDLVIT